MIYQYQTKFDVDKLASSMLQVGSFDAEILSLERLLAFKAFFRASSMSSGLNLAVFLVRAITYTLEENESGTNWIWKFF